MSALVMPIPSRRAAELVVEHHYLHRRPPISHAFGMFSEGETVGVVTYGTPASRHLQMGVSPADPSLVIELNRLWIRDDMPTNTASWFVSRTLAQLPPLIVVSYADPARGHSGTVYRAMNFRYAGWTDMDRKTPRLDYIPLDGASHTREASRSGVLRKVRRVPKVKYWTTTGTPAQRRALARVCQWPDLKWSDNPPPMPGDQHRQLATS